MSRLSWKSSTAYGRLLSPVCRPPSGATPWPRTSPWPTVPRKGWRRSPTAGTQTWAPSLGALAPKTVLPAAELLMLPNGKPDRLGMTVLLDALHQGK